MESFTISTKGRSELVDITGQVSGIVRRSRIREGACIVYVPHATAAVTVIENYDPAICMDFLDWFDREVPWGAWRHDRVDGNGAAHIKAGVIGPSESLIVHDGKLVLGTWQALVFCEFDGPRSGRKIVVKLF